MTSPRPPFSRPITIADLPSAGRDITVVANAEELASIARELGLVALHALSGAFHLRPTAKGARLSGEVTARLRQTCVVSLEDFDSEFKEPVELIFAFQDDGDMRRNERLELEISPTEEDPPDPIINGRIDLGAVSLEFLALGLDPHPRKPGIEFTPAGSEPEKRPSPFAPLATLKVKPPDEK